MDERKAFEAWYEGNALPGEADWFALDSMGEYKWSDTAACWEGWQARAALSEQAAVAAPATPGQAAALLGAIARGWCHPVNAGKTVDPDLATAIASEILAINAATPQPAPAPASEPNNWRDAYEGAREDLLDWKRRALEAEELNRKFMAEINGPTFLGEPAAQRAAEVKPSDQVAFSDLFMQHFEPMVGNAASDLVKDAARLAAACAFKASPAAPQPAEPSLSDAQDAKRWRTFAATVGGMRREGSARPAEFRYPSLMELPPVSNIMQGSVYQHFAAAVDAYADERAALAAGKAGV